MIPEPRSEARGSIAISDEIMKREIGLRTASGAETENLIGPAMRHKILTAPGYVGTLVEGVKIAVGSWAAME
jgi:hypothetical protein